LLSAKGEFIAILMLILYLKRLYKTIPYFRIQNWGCSNPLGTSKQLFGINKIQALL
jgi:hypothetical protein